MRADVWRLRIDECDRAIATRRSAAGVLRAAGFVDSAELWEAEIVRLERRRSQVLAWRTDEL